MACHLLYSFSEESWIKFNFITNFSTGEITKLTYGYALQFQYIPIHVQAIHIIRYDIVHVHTLHSGKSMALLGSVTYAIWNATVMSFTSFVTEFTCLWKRDQRLMWGLNKQNVYVCLTNKKFGCNMRCIIYRLLPIHCSLVYCRWAVRGKESKP